jgi:hypothetical protein
MDGRTSGAAGCYTCFLNRESSGMEKFCGFIGSISSLNCKYLREVLFRGTALVALTGNSNVASFSEERLLSLPVVEAMIFNKRTDC